MATGESDEESCKEHIEFTRTRDVRPGLPQLCSEGTLGAFLHGGVESELLGWARAAGPWGNCLTLGLSSLISKEDVPGELVALGNSTG